MSGIVYGIGLPRCGGQTLKAVLTQLLGGCIHGPSTRVEAYDHPCVEVFRDPWVLMREHPNCRFILNVRDEGPWLASCERVYQHRKHWQNPLWKYPLCDFQWYRERYLRERSVLPSCFQWDITRQPVWEPVCRWLGVSVPRVPFPQVDYLATRPPVCGSSGGA